MFAYDAQPGRVEDLALLEGNQNVAQLFSDHLLTCFCATWCRYSQRSSSASKRASIRSSIFAARSCSLSSCPNSSSMSMSASRMPT